MVIFSGIKKGVFSSRSSQVKYCECMIISSFSVFSGSAHIARVVLNGNNYQNTDNYYLLYPLHLCIDHVRCLERNFSIR